MTDRCCCIPSAPPATPNNVVVSGLGGSLDPRVEPTPGTGGIRVAAGTTVRCLVALREDAVRRRCRIQITAAVGGDDIEGEIAGSAYSVPAVNGDTATTATDVATAINAISGVSAVAGTYEGEDAVIVDGDTAEDYGFSAAVTGANGTTIANFCDASSADVRVYGRGGSGDRAADWQTLGAATATGQAFFADVDFGGQRTSLEIQDETHVYPTVEDLAGNASDSGTITYLAWASVSGPS